MDEKTLESLDELLGYYYADERANWEEWGRPKTGHIYCHLDRVIKWRQKTYSSSP